MLPRLRHLWSCITVNPEDGSPLFGVPYLGPVAVACALAWLVWCCVGPL